MADKIRKKVLFCFVLLNFIVSLMINSGYLFLSSSGGGFSQSLYGVLLLLSNTLMLYLVVGLIIWLVNLLIKGRKTFFVVNISLFVLFHLVNLIDLIIFKVFKFHINGMVINLFFTEGTWDSVHIGWSNFLLLGLIIASFILLQVFLLRKLFTFWTKNPQAAYLSTKKMVIFSSVLVLIMLSEKSVYAVSDLFNKYEVMRFSKVMPLYQPLTIKRMMKKRFNFEVDRETNFKVSKKDSQTLNYPKNKLSAEKLNKYPNIVWIIIDAWRYDMLTPGISPNVSKFLPETVYFKNHYSGGNASRFGVFSLFYGVNAFYWQNFLSERQSPVFIDELQKLDYDFRILSSTKLTYPEFRKTAFVNIPQDIDDELPGVSTEQRDPALAQHFIKWMQTKNSNKPFFSFLFFDAPHGPYAFSPDCNVYQPSNKSANYITGDKKNVQPLKNSYQNAILFDDKQVGKVLDYLKSNKMLDNTIVLITGDHGEEFYESGYLGHTSAFSEQQTHVPLVLYMPEQYKKDLKPTAEVSYLTSHLDVVPTFLSILNYKNDYRDYSQGQNLFDGKGHDYVVSSGWNNAALIDGQYKVVFSTESYNAGLFEIRDSKYKIVDNQKTALQAVNAKLLKVMQEFSEFLK